MRYSLRDLAGLVTVLGGLGVLFKAVTVLHEKDYLACVILAITGLSLARLGSDLLRSGG